MFEASKGRLCTILTSIKRDQELWATPYLDNQDITGRIRVGSVCVLLGPAVRIDESGTIWVQVLNDSNVGWITESTLERL